MAKKKKSKWWLWTLLVLLLVFSGFILLGGVLFGIGVQPQDETGTETETGTSGGSSGGTDETPEDDFSWFSFPDFDWDFDIPCFWNCDDGTDEGTENDLDDFTFENCRIDSDCADYCQDPTDARCIAGDCSCAEQTPEETPTCYDSDKELIDRDTTVYEIAGTCDDTGFLDRDEYSDYCSRGELVEYYCRTDTACSYVTINCAEELNNPDAICYDGMCTWIA
jgi:hypothetical protein